MCVGALDKIIIRFIQDYGCDLLLLVIFTVQTVQTVHFISSKMRVLIFFFIQV
jgi:hypothetical protein